VPFTNFSRLDYHFATPGPWSPQMLWVVKSPPDSTGTLHADELEIRVGQGLVLATGRPLTLSVREFELLVAMARRMGAIITREQLYESVWGGNLRTGDRSVDVYVSKLRGKLEAALPDRSFIHTHPGFGYRFQPQPAREGGPHSAEEPPRDGTAARAKTGSEGSESTLSRNVHIGTIGA
jgi:DNA-binding response OmpR family regulator